MKLNLSNTGHSSVREKILGAIGFQKQLRSRSGGAFEERGIDFFEKKGKGASSAGRGTQLVWSLFHQGKNQHTQGEKERYSEATRVKKKSGQHLQGAILLPRKKKKSRSKKTHVTKLKEAATSSS